MKIPGSPDEREAFYWDIVTRCLVSRQDRRAHYDRLRNYFLFGCAPESSQALFNKINSHMDQLTAFLFAADTTRFAIRLGAGVDKATQLPMARPLVSRLNDKWEDSNSDIIFSNAVTWSLVYDSMFVKLIQRGSETMPFLVESANFGVLREDVPMLDRQEAFVHVFFTTKDQLRRDLDLHPKKEILLARLAASRKMESELPAGVQRIIMSTLYPLAGQMTGNAPAPLANEDIYRPRTSEELVEMYELWLWDDGVASEDKKRQRMGGYRCVTLADPSICIYDRLAYDPESKDGRQMFLQGEHPFTQICPNPAYDYFWGYSEVQKLTRLQDQREHHMSQATELVDRNVNPPKASKGMWGAVDEKNLALQKMNALISSTADPTAEVKEFKPSVPSDLWQLVDRDDAMFDQASALTNISMGRGEVGVRSKGQTDSLMRAASARPKKRALIIEDSLERLATLYVKLDKAHNKDPMMSEPLDDGQKAEPFLAAQFTDDFMAKVDAHSSSPGFMEQQTDEVLAMFDRGIVDGDAVLDVMHPQNIQALKIQYKRMQEARQEQAARQEALQKAEAAGKIAGKIGGGAGGVS